MTVTPCLPGLERIGAGFTLETPPAGCFILLDILVDGELTTPAIDDTPHFATLAEAYAALRRNDGPDAPPLSDRAITRLLSPCVALFCHCRAYSLGEDDDETPASELHFETLTEAIDYATDHGMTVAGRPGREHLLFDVDQAWDQRHRHRFDCASLSAAANTAASSQRHEVAA